MTKEEIKDIATNEIVRVLYSLGGSSSYVFPDFSLDCGDLLYGIQETDEGISLETIFKNRETNDKMLVKLKIEVD